MKILQLTDMHYEHWTNSMRVRDYRKQNVDPYPEIERDLTLLTGDIHSMKIMPDVLMKFAEFSPVGYIAGNHEYYGEHYESMNTLVVEFAKTANTKFPIHVLVPYGHFEFNGMVFIGATLWTNFDNNNAMVKQEAHWGMNDYHVIRHGLDKRLNPDVVLDWHNEQLDYIRKTLKDNEGKPCVVFTHHAPSRQSVSPFFRGDGLNGAFVSDLDQFIIEHKPKAWFHGHVHDSFDYMIDETRVVCNPRGYVGERPWQPIVVSV